MLDKKDLLMWENSPEFKIEYDGITLGDGASMFYRIACGT